MKTIIIKGQRELAELPDLWYTDGTDEANKWGEAVYIAPAYFNKKYKLIANDSSRNSQAFVSKDIAEKLGHTYITHSEFLRLVYEPWKESQNVNLPTTYENVVRKVGQFFPEHDLLPAHINACIQLTNIMNFANDAFEGDGKAWVVDRDGDIWINKNYTHPIRFTSKAAAKWAYKTFPEIFKAYLNA